MEEILASIRRIISEDDAPAETAHAAAPAPEPEPAYEPEPAPVESASPAMMDETPSVQDDDVFELTDRYEAPAAESIGDLDVSASEPERTWAPEPEPFPAAAPAPAPVAPAASNDGLIGAVAAGAAVNAFAGLTAAVRKPEPDAPAGPGTSLEALVGSLLRPMLKDWLDANLPAIVEAQVRKEVERIARQAG